MLIAGCFAKRLGKRLLMNTCCRRIFPYAGMLLAHSPAILPGLQLLNAIYIGILGVDCMLYFQDLMPDKRVQPQSYKYHSRGLDYCRIVGGYCR